MEQLFEMRGLAPVGPWVVAAIVAKAIGYAAALLAMGGVLYLGVFPETDSRVKSLVVRLTVTIAFLGATFVLLRLGIAAARLSGAGLAGATDPMMLGFAWQSPLGTSSLLRLLGFAGVLGLLLPGAVGFLIASAGAVMIGIAYAFVGHSLGEPRWVLAALLIAHLLAAAFWVGALVPLWCTAAGGAPAADLLHRFGTIATWTVSALVLIGLVYTWYLSGSPLALIGTAHGTILLSKIAAVGLLLGLAALNKLRLVPATAAGSRGAPAALRRSIAFEGAVVVAILLLTAALTSVTVPPVNLDEARPGTFATERSFA